MKVHQAVDFPLRLRARKKSTFLELDYRSLAGARVLIGIAAIFQLKGIYVAMDLAVGEGLYSTQLARSYIGAAWILIPSLWLENAGVAWSCLVAGFAATLLFLVGFRTRESAALSALASAAAWARALPFGPAAEAETLLFLCLLSFVPCAEYCSFDARVKYGSAVPRFIRCEALGIWSRALSIGVRGVLLAEAIASGLRQVKPFLDFPVQKGPDFAGPLSLLGAFGNLFLALLVAALCMLSTVNDRLINVRKWLLLAVISILALRYELYRAGCDALIFLALLVLIFGRSEWLMFRQLFRMRRGLLQWSTPVESLSKVRAILGAVAVFACATLAWADYERACGIQNGAVRDTRIEALRGTGFLLPIFSDSIAQWWIFEALTKNEGKVSANSLLGARDTILNQAVGDSWGEEFENSGLSYFYQRMSISQDPVLYKIVRSFVCRTLQSRGVYLVRGGILSRSTFKDSVDLSPRFELPCARE